MRIVEYPWERLDINTINSADGIVVLSSSRSFPPGNTKIIEWRDPDRFLAGIQLYKAKKSKRLIFTGGINPYNLNLPPEGNIYMGEASSIGIAKKDIFTTYPVFNTFQEAEAVKKILKKEITSTQHKIILVTSAFHMKRAKKLFEREGIIVQPYPVDFKSSKRFIWKLRDPVTWLPSAFHLQQSSLAIREIIGRIIYRTFK